MQSYLIVILNGLFEIAEQIVSVAEITAGPALRSLVIQRLH